MRDANIASRAWEQNEFNRDIQDETPPLFCVWALYLPEDEILGLEVRDTPLRARPDSDIKHYGTMYCRPTVLAPTDSHSHMTNFAKFSLRIFRNLVYRAPIAGAQRGINPERLTLRIRQTMI